LIEIPYPEVPFNPVTAATPLTVAELIAAPIGLAAVLPFVPGARWLARVNRVAALLALAGLWLVLTLGPVSTAIFVGATLVASGYLCGLVALRRREWLSKRGMIAATWIGLNLLALPLWWKATWWWYSWEHRTSAWPDTSRLAVFHSIGFAYVLLRLIAWGVDWAKEPRTPLRPAATLCWLFYPPIVRNGPFLLRQHFLERFDAWDPRTKVPWRRVLTDLGGGLLGAAVMVVLFQNLPKVTAGGVDFFAAPWEYDTNTLLRAVYLIPILVYFFLWTYNQFALGISRWVGIPVDSNFHWLPTATSFREFWRRWNLNVGAWIRDYIYIPLGGKHAFGPLVYLASFGYCGIWHGAAPSFLAWPLVPIVALSIQRRWDEYRRWRGWDQRPSSRLWLGFSWLLTMHCGVLTVFIFSDFEHVGLRVFGELWRRLAGFIMQSVS
jgi:D-alanyl-lipoteichoic acid acyltransferase DltB (MBOAT superfamily)